MILRVNVPGPSKQVTEMRMSKKKKSLVRENSERSQREKKCFVNRWVSKCCGDLQKTIRRVSIISLFFYVQAIVLVTQQGKYLSFVFVLKVTLLTPSAPQITTTHILEAHHVPGSVLGTLCMLFYLTLTATLWRRCQQLHLQQGKQMWKRLIYYTARKSQDQDLWSCMPHKLNRSVINQIK